MSPVRPYCGLAEKAGRTAVLRLMGRLFNLAMNLGCFGPFGLQKAERVALCPEDAVVDQCVTARHFQLKFHHRGRSGACPRVQLPTR